MRSDVYLDVEVEEKMNAREFVDLIDQAHGGRVVVLAGAGISAIGSCGRQLVGSIRHHG